jgi:hypothetical protein
LVLRPPHVALHDNDHGCPAGQDPIPGGLEDNRSAEPGTPNASSISPSPDRVFRVLAAAVQPSRAPPDRS